MKMLILPEIEGLIHNVCGFVKKDAKFINDIIHNKGNHWKTIVVFNGAGGSGKNVLIKFLESLDRGTIYISTNEKFSHLESNTHEIRVITGHKALPQEAGMNYNNIINKYISGEK